MTARGLPDSIPEVETGRLLLRAPRLEDAEGVFRCLSDPEVTRYIVAPTQQSPMESEQWLETRLSAHKANLMLPWIVFHPSSAEVAGFCGYIEWSAEHERAEIIYFLSRRFWGRGFATEMVRAMIPFGFEQLELNRIEARCVAGNTASSRVMEKAGMSYEGTLRQREFAKGSYWDICTYAVLGDEPA